MLISYPTRQIDLKLVEAIKQQNYFIAQSALASGANPDCYDISGDSLLHFCVRMDYQKILELLIKHKANLEILNTKEITPLYYAILLGKIDCALILIQANCSLRFLDANKDSYLHAACAKGRTYPRMLAVVDALLKKGMRTFLKNERGETPLHMASRYGTVDIIKRLYESPQDLRSRDIDGFCLLHSAVCGIDNAPAVQLILELGADSNQKEGKGNTPLHLIANKSLIKAADLVYIQLLIKHKANLWARDAYGYTAFEVASTSQKQGRLIPNDMLALLQPKGVEPVEVKPVFNSNNEDWKKNKTKGKGKGKGKY